MAPNDFVVVYPSENWIAEYQYWRGKTPYQIRQAVRRLPFGWASVWKSTPSWANRVRNFFNETPEALARLGRHEEQLAIGRVSSLGNPAGSWALNGEVYKDRHHRLWYLLLPGANTYHVGDGHPSEFAKYTGMIAGSGEIFKLVSPDGTGGSREIIIKNWLLPKSGPPTSTLGAGPGVWFDIRRRVDVNHITMGSYNYSETIVQGFGAHKLRDMEPHEKMRGEYLNPYMWSSLKSRRFPHRI